jgi:hypothetical protein
MPFSGREYRDIGSDTSLAANEGVMNKLSVLFMANTVCTQNLKYNK